MTEQRFPTNNPFAYLLARFLLLVTGWRVAGELPAVPKAVVIAAPHTSAWDGFFMLVVAGALRIRLTWMVKASALRWPWSWILKRFNAMPIDRKAHTGVVDAVAQAFEESDALAVVISPPGTRARRDHWKSGFYHIARTANVPVLCSFLDYRKKLGGLGPLFELTGDPVRDMDPIRTFYEPVIPRFPELRTTIRLLEEENETLPDSRS